MDTQDYRNLSKRYLVWLYKTNREAFEKIERKFTQLEIDNQLAKKMKASLKGDKFNKLFAEMAVYIANKQKDAQNLKFGAAGSRREIPEYAFLKAKLKAIESIIACLFGKNELNKIKAMYENEMTIRIMQSKDR